MAKRFRDKDPADVIDYSLDWTDELALVSPADTISTSTWTVTTGLTLSSPLVTGAVTIIVVAGGVAGTEYRLTNTIVTTGGRTVQRTYPLLVREIEQ